MHSKSSSENDITVTDRQKCISKDVNFRKKKEIYNRHERGKAGHRAGGKELAALKKSVTCGADKGRLGRRKKNGHKSKDR